MTLHLVYPFGPSTRCPDAIGRELGRRLAEHFDVVHWDWDEPRRIRPDDGDVLVGHPHPNPWTVFRRSMSSNRWRRIVALFPYNADVRQSAYADSVVCRADVFLALTGPFWFDRVETGPFAHWRPRMRRLDLAIDVDAFPQVKTTFAPAGSRRFLYIGHSGWQKNPSYLSALAHATPEGRWGWIGSGPPIAGFEHFGYRDLGRPEVRALVGEFDFVVTVGRYDANPAAVLEAMAWGLIPVCTPQSGYVEEQGVVNIPLDDVPAAVAALRRLQSMPEQRLHDLQVANRQAVETHFTWDQAARDVLAAVADDRTADIGRLDFAATARLRAAALSSPYAPWRPRNLRCAAGAALRSSRRSTDDRRPCAAPPWRRTGVRPPAAASLPAAVPEIEEVEPT